VITISMINGCCCCCWPPKIVEDCVVVEEEVNNNIDDDDDDDGDVNVDVGESNCLEIWLLFTGNGIEKFTDGTVDIIWFE